MVGAFPSQTIDMPSTIEARYYLLATVTARQWGNYRCSFSINSRHSGCGMVTVAFGNNTNSLIHNNMYAQIYYYGTTNQVTDSQMFQVYGSADGKHYYLFAKSWDYNDCKIRVFDSDFVLSRGNALTSIPTDTYGTLLCNTTINPSNSVSWNDVSGKPSTYTPSSHTHTKSQITDFPSKLEPYFANNTWYVVGDDAAIGDHNKGGAFCVKGLKGTPNVSLYNSDDSYYGQCITTADIGSQSVKYATTAGSANAVAWGNISGKPSTYAPSSHTHDDRYYTESEMNTKLNAKAASDIVTISSTQPTSDTCKIWIKI